MTTIHGCYDEADAHARFEAQDDPDPDPEITQAQAQESIDEDNALYAAFAAQAITSPPQYFIYFPGHTGGDALYSRHDGDYMLCLTHGEAEAKNRNIVISSPDPDIADRETENPEIFAIAMWDSYRDCCDAAMETVFEGVLNRGDTMRRFPTTAVVVAVGSQELLFSVTNNRQ